MASESSTLLEQAQAASKDRAYERALELFNQAVDAEPSAEALAGRAAVHNKLKNHLEAAADASRATELDERLAAAHKEKGLALHAMEEYESALDAFEAAAALEPSKTIHTTWANMCRVQLGEEPPQPSRPVQLAAPAPEPGAGPSTSGAGAGAGGSGSGSGISLSGDSLKAFMAAAGRPGGLPVSLRAAAGGAGGLPPRGGGAVIEELQEEEEGTAQPKAATLDDPEFAKYWKAPVAGAVAASLPDMPAGAKYRHQWFQSPERVEVDVLAKGLRKEQVGVTIEAQRLRVVTICADGQEDYSLDLSLHAPVLPDQCRWEVLGTKVEVKLLKAVPGTQWAALEAGGAAAAAAAPAAPAQAPEAAAAAPAGPTGAYPYAGKRVDWDKVAQDLKQEEKEEKLEGDQALMKFFRELYDGGDEDTRRAMVKSMQESGGTALSMNWGEVGEKDYSKRKEGEQDDEDWAARTSRRQR